MECGPSNCQPKRKRLRNIIKHDTGPKRSRPEYHTIFERVLKVYLDAKACQPLGSSLHLLDSSLRSAFKRWTPDVAHTCVDFENAVTKALANEPELQKKFMFWFVCDQRPEFKAADTLVYNRIVKKCAGEFLRRGMFPLSKWFRVPGITHDAITES